MDYLRGHALHEIFLNKQTVKERERKRKREKEKMLRMVWYRVGALWYVFFFPLGSLQTIVNENVFFRQQV